MFTHNQTVGDRLEPLRKQLLDRGGVPVNLSGATITFRMISRADGSVKIANAAAIIENAAEGRVRYEWAANDVNTAGDYWAWFIRSNGSTVERYPTGFQLLIHMVRNS